MKRVTALYRVSIKGQVEKDDIPMQKIECRNFIAMHKDWILVREVYEKGVSGFKVSSEKRDAIQDIKADAVNKKFDVLLVFMFDRLGRKEDETPFVVEWFVKQGIEVWSVKEGQQRFENHVDKLTNYIRFWQASGESIKTGIRVRTKQEQMTLDGIFRGGAIAYGFKLVPSTRVNKKGYQLKDVALDEEKAARVRMIFEKYIFEGFGVYALANYMNATFPNDKIWRPSSINTVLRNPVYTGRFRFNDTLSDPHENLRVVPDEWLDMVEEIMKSRTTRKASKDKGLAPLRNSGRYLLSGILYCGECGGRMTGSTAYSKYVCKTSDKVTRKSRRIYRCYDKSISVTDCKGQSTYSAKIIEEAVDQIVMRYFMNVRSAPREEMYQKARQTAERQAKLRRDEANKRLASLEKEIGLLRDEILRCLAGASAFDRDELNLMLLEKRQALETAKEEAAKVEAEWNNSHNANNQAETDYKRLLGWVDEYMNASMEVKRMILYHLIKKVTVHRGYQITIEMTVSAKQFFGQEDEISNAS